MSASTNQVQGNEAKYPQYRCHKVVEAFRIAGIAHITEANKIVEHELTDHECKLRVRVSPAWLGKHKPEVGGYWVRYADGYESYSPAGAFEGGYTELVKKPALPIGISEGYTPALKAKLENWFTYHAPEQDDAQRYERIRAAGLDFATVLAECCPQSADLTVAIRKVREAVMTANAAIACGGK